MAPSTITITVGNRTGAGMRYLLFMELPQHTNGPSGQVLLHVYDRSPKVESGHGSHVTWQCSSDVYAIYGTSSTSKDGRVQVSTGAYEGPVKLGPQGSVYQVDIDEDGNPSFHSDLPDSTDAQKGFTIQTGNFTFPNKYHTHIGLGALSPRSGNDDVVPVMTYEAEPQLTTLFFPHQVYYLCAGEHEAGTVVDRFSIGQVVKLDFSTAAIPSVAVYHNDQGNYALTSNDKVITKGELTTDNGVVVSIVDL